MLQCADCEYYEQDSTGRRIFRCDPFTNIKEPECLMKWQMLKLDMLVAHHQTMLSWQKKMGPMQDKLFKYVKRELDDIEDSEKWKLPDDECPENPPDELA